MVKLIPFVSRPPERPDRSDELTQMKRHRGCLIARRITRSWSWSSGNGSWRPAPPRSTGCWPRAARRREIPIDARHVRARCCADTMKHLRTEVVGSRKKAHLRQAGQAFRAPEGLPPNRAGPIGPSSALSGLAESLRPQAHHRAKTPRLTI